MYIDPNTGGVIFQVLGAIVLAGSGVLFFFSRSIREGISRIRRHFRKDKEEN